MKKLISSIMFLSLIFIVNGQSKNAYLLYKSNGDATNYETMLSECKNKKIIFFGEFHNNTISHWLQYELTKDIFNIVGNRLKLGAEMFEADNQLLIDEYLKNIIEESKFEDEAKLWNNYKTDYKPLLKFAKINNLEFIATNIPRRYASVVHKKGGLDALTNISAEAKLFIAPLPIVFNEEKYLKLFGNVETMGSKTTHAMDNKTNPMKFLAQSQAIKDATMAYFIQKNIQNNTIFVHFNGVLHSDNYEGIVNYMDKINRNDILVITTVLQDNINKLEKENFYRGDYIICVPTTMTTTY